MGEDIVYNPEVMLDLLKYTKATGSKPSWDFISKMLIESTEDNKGYLAYEYDDEEDDEDYDVFGMDEGDMMPSIDMSGNFEWDTNPTNVGGGWSIPTPTPTPYTNVPKPKKPTPPPVTPRKTVVEETVTEFDDDYLRRLGLKR